MNILSLLTLIIILIDLKCKKLNPHCNESNCSKPSGECIDDICLCSAGYTTIQSIEENDKVNTDTKYCNYSFKYKDWAAYYELVFPFGVGHFYAMRYFYGLVKFIIFWVLSFSNVIFKKRLRVYPKVETALTCLMWIFGLMYVADYILFNFDFYKDGNGIVML